MIVPRHQFYLERTPWTGGIAMRLLIENGQNRGYASELLAKAITTENEGQIIEPFLRISTDDAQRLMDELWNCGIRPSEGSGSAGAMAAVERHMRDLQRLVFEKDEPKVVVHPFLGRSGDTGEQK